MSLAGSPVRRILRTVVLVLLLLLYLGALLYSTLEPFRFSRHPGLERNVPHKQVEWIPFSRPCPDHGVLCPRDTGLNVVAFAPLGAFLVLLSRSSGGVLRRAGQAAAMGSGLSLLIETLQYFIPARFPSTTDLLLNTLGTWLGGVLIAAFAGIERRRSEPTGLPDSTSV